MGEADAAFAGQVAPLLKDPRVQARAAAAEGLSMMGETGSAFAGQVAVLLKDRGPGARAAAAEGLGRMGEAGAAFAGQVALLRVCIAAVPQQRKDSKSRVLVLRKAVARSRQNPV